MSKIFIEDYKGQSIEYDVDCDKFVCNISIEDKYKKAKRGSLADLRKEVDTFIKLNLEFKPIKALRKSDYSDEFTLVTIEKLRTDGMFIVKPCNSDRMDHVTQEQAAKYFKFDADLWEVLQNSNKQLREVCNNEQDRHKNLVKELCAKLVPANIPKYEI